MKINIKNIRVKSICATLFISLFLACNNGIEELEKRNTFLSSLANLGNDFLSVFTSLGDSIGSVLGFNDKTTKSEVGKYFGKIHDAVKNTKDKLNQLVSNMKDKGNPNAEATAAAVKTLIENTLDKIIQGAKTVNEAIGTDTSDLLGDVASGNTKGSGGDIENLVQGIKTIVEVVLDAKEGNAEAGDNKIADDNSTQRSNDGASKLFDGSMGIASNEKQSANDAVKAVGAVTGADILKAIIKEGGDAGKLAKHNAAISTVGVTAPKDAAVAGGIALRAMAKNGHFANASSSIAVEIKRAVTSAVTKALNTLTIAIRKTIDEGLKTVKEAMKLNPETTPVTIEAKN
ncbi:variable large family protein (plasmid) [Borrelia coriaceae]|uniref:Variable large protein n=1 Tax=Borrelia coriaceae ATCC 43381 TaxID=1408429 RepID=W5SX51_9SPIR|nr:variable large family protein [Borrelia coriaceae]AHH11442.1 Variable outer membrane protein [Borrelia coriaceae ATCC 43381]UPA17404.1 variable large family protein [Borrelia coriaceae]